jgi:hypothetical protein
MNDNFCFTPKLKRYKIESTGVRRGNKRKTQPKKQKQNFYLNTSSQWNMSAKYIHALGLIEEHPNSPT